MKFYSFNYAQEPIHSFQSISIANLKVIVESMSNYVNTNILDPYDVSPNDIWNYLVEGGTHPAELFPAHFSNDSPEAALTYERKLVFGDIFSFLNDEQLEATRSNWAIEYSLSSQTRIWIDVLFIDQVCEQRRSYLSDHEVFLLDLFTAHQFSTAV